MDTREVASPSSTDLFAAAARTLHKVEERNKNAVKRVKGTTNHRQSF